MVQRKSNQQAFLRMSILSEIECRVTEGFLVDNLFTRNKYCEKSVWWGANILLPKPTNPFLVRPYYQVRYYSEGTKQGFIMLRGQMGLGRSKARVMCKKKVCDCIEFLTALEDFKGVLCKIWEFKKEDLVVTKMQIN